MKISGPALTLLACTAIAVPATAQTGGLGVSRPAMPSLGGHPGGPGGNPSKPPKPPEGPGFWHGGHAPIFYGYGALERRYGDDERPDGSFFAGRAYTEVENGRVHYDYDRSYPYDHYRSSRGAGLSMRNASPPGCSVTWTWDDSAAEQVPVRVCRR